MLSENGDIAVIIPSPEVEHMPTLGDAEPRKTAADFSGNRA